MSLETILATAKAFGDETRLGIYRFLTTRRYPVSVVDVAEQFSLHPNAARAHLVKLEQAGLATSSPDRGRGGGRPRRVYSAATIGMAPIFEPAIFKATTGLLLEVVATRADLDAAAVEAIAQDWGVQYAGNWEQEGAVEAMTADYILPGLVRTLETWGFVADLDEEQGVTISRCPLDDLAERHPDGICPLVHGVLQGMLLAVRPDGALGWTRGARGASGRRCSVQLALKDPRGS